MTLNNKIDINELMMLKRKYFEIFKTKQRVATEIILITKITNDK